MSKSKTLALWALLLVASSARFLLQIAPMPPYAGLDELYHVARVAFVAQEHRNPKIDEPSIPVDLEESALQSASAVPAFGVIGKRWPDAVAAGMRMPSNAYQPTPDWKRRTFGLANYEAQQPSLYYTVAAALLRSTRSRVRLDELRLLRMLSAGFAVMATMFAAWIGWRLFGAAGIVASALVLSDPTWLTLVARAGNDAMACALIAAGLALTVRGRPAWLEGVAWALAIMTKLYTLPVLVALPVLWWVQRAPRRRVVTVALLIAVALAIVTIGDLHPRTNNPVGLTAFDIERHGAAGDIDWLGTARLFIPTFILTLVWTSGQHGDALTPLGLVLFAGPLLLMLLAARRHYDRKLLLPFVAALIGFGCAQLVDLAGFIRAARAAGLSIPEGGPGGWYWHALVPLAAAAIVAPFVARAPRTVVLFFAAWILVWDIGFSERALFRDWSGTSSPAHRGTLFRWGDLDRAPERDFAVGPAAAATVELRAIHLAAVVALLALTLFSPKATPTAPHPHRASAAEPASRDA